MPRGTRIGADVSELVEETAAERELARTKQQLANVERIALTGSWQWDLETGTTYHSQELMRMHGVAASDEAAQYAVIIGLVHPEDRERVVANVARNTQLGTAGDEIYRIVRPDGAVRVLRSRYEVVAPEGSPRTIVGTVQDVTEDVELRRALQLQRAVFESQIEASADAIVVVDDHGICLAMSRKLTSLGIDLPPESTELDLLHAVAESAVDASLAPVVPGPTSPRAGDLALRNGKFVEWSATPVFGNEGIVSGRLWQFRDVTARKKAELAAAESERFMRVVIDTIPCALSLLHDGRYIVANQTFADLAGMRRETIGQIDLNQARLKMPAVDIAMKESDTVLATGQALYEADKAVVLPSGERRTFQIHRIPVDLPGRGKAVLTVGMDITQRLYAEAAQARSEAQFRKLIEHSPDAIAVHRGGSLLYCNAAVASALGYDSPEALLGKPVMDLVHPDERPRARERLTAVSGTGRTAPLAEIRFLRVDGTEVVFESTVMELDFEGAPAFVTVARNVTERKALQARMFEADRMASIGTLAAGVAHEINNPLAYISTNIEVAAEELSRLEHVPAAADALREITAALADAKDGAERVRVIVRDLKTFSRADDIDRRVSVDVCEALESALQMARNEIRPRAELVRDYGPVPAVEANDARLAQVFLNIVVNAAHAIDEGQANRNAIRVATRTDASGRAVVEIGDSGCGMTPEVQRRIFDPFFTTKAIGQGTGLGLSISKGIVEAIGGEISLESTPGIGTTFRVVLPPKTAPLPAPAPTRTLPPAAPERLGSVLLIDDDLGIARAVRRVLSSYRIDIVTGAREIIDTLEMLERYDVILCDLMMPEVSGMDLHARVLERAPHIADRFVFITGGAFTPVARAFLDTVPNPKVSKPFSVTELRSVVAGRLAEVETRAA